MSGWRRPGRVLAVEPGEDYVQLADGTIRRSHKVTYDLETTNRIRSGYLCANCMEPFEVPWPRACGFCGVAVRDRQMEYFEREYSGQIDLGPTDWSAELDSLEERRLKEEEKRGA